MVVAGTYCLIAVLRTFCPRRSEAQWPGAVHDFLSIAYEAQSKEAARFYAGETTEDQRLALIYGQRFRYVVTSRPGLLPSQGAIAIAGRYQLYAFPGNTVDRYPGAAALGLTTGSTPRQGVLHKLQSWMPIRPRGL